VTASADVGGNSEFGVPRAYVQLTATSTENQLGDVMDTPILRLVSKLANDAAGNFEITSQDRDGLGTAYHEAGTLWMGLDPTHSVTDTNRRFHGVANAFCADQSVFVTAGSVNPALRA